MTKNNESSFNYKAWLMYIVSGIILLVSGAMVNSFKDLVSSTIKLAGIVNAMKAEQATVVKDVDGLKKRVTFIEDITGVRFNESTGYSEPIPKKNRRLRPAKEGLLPKEITIQEDKQYTYEP